MWPTRDIIDLISARVPAECCEGSATANARALSARLPGIFSAYYFECRLSPQDDQVDFLASLSASHGAGQMQRIAGAAEQAASGRGRRSTWGVAWSAVRCWANSVHKWYLGMPFVWLEFDRIGSRPVTGQVPSLCICVDSRYPSTAPAAPPDTRDSLQRYLDYLAEAIPSRFDDLLPRSARRTMSTCFGRLPPGGRIIHVSLMLARDPMTVKLYGAVPKACLSGYLSEIGWPGPAALLEHVMRSFCTDETGDDVVYFDLSLDGGLLPHVAIAFSQLQIGVGANTDPRRGALLRRLEEHGLCAPNKHRALMTWPGESWESLPSTHSWARMSRCLDTKIFIHGERGISAKGYLGFAPISSVF